MILVIIVVSLRRERNKETFLFWQNYTVNIWWKAISGKNVPKGPTITLSKSAERLLQKSHPELTLKTFQICRHAWIFWIRFPTPIIESQKKYSKYVCLDDQDTIVSLEVFFPRSQSTLGGSDQNNPRLWNRGRVRTKDNASYCRKRTASKSGDSSQYHCLIEGKLMQKTAITLRKSCITSPKAASNRQSTPSWGRRCELRETDYEDR